MAAVVVAMCVNGNVVVVGVRLAVFKILKHVANTDFNCSAFVQLK